MDRNFVSSNPRNICIVGLWHQATVLAACFSEMGHHVRAVGSDANAVEKLARGQAPVFEPRLDDLLKDNIQAGRLEFTSDFRQALQNAEFVFLAIDTPVNADDSPE